MELFETVLMIFILCTWFVLSLIFLISAIQDFIYNLKRERRDLEREQRDLEYHEARMKEFMK